MKRRSFLRNALLGTTAVAITPAAFLASCKPTELDPSVIFGSVGGLTVPEPPFVSPIAQLNPISAIGASIEASKNSPILIGINPTFCFGYGSGIWGPTLRIRQGESVNIDFTNSINEPTNLHFHGLMLNAGEDDGVDDAIENTGSQTYNFTVNNRAGLYWYHPQYGKSSGKQINIGLGGLFVVEDDEEDSVNLPSGDREMFLVLQDKRFNVDNSMFYGTSTAEQMVGYFGETIMINGVTGALKDGLSQRYYRLRICNASNARIYNLALENEDGSEDLGFTIIGGDGGLLPNITADPTPFIYLAPGERVDVIVDFTTIPVGSFAKLVSRQFGNAGAWQGAAGFTLMHFNITEAFDETYNIPGSLPAVVSLSEGDATNTRTFDVSNNQLTKEFATAHVDSGDMHQIEGEAYETGVSSFEVNAGSTELWEFVNNGAEPVAMHIYGVQFQLIERVGGRGNIRVWEKSWKDTILALPTETVRIVIPFNMAPGRYFFCATNLEMADSGMIQAFDVV